MISIIYITHFTLFYYELDPDENSDNVVELYKKQLDWEI